MRSSSHDTPPLPHRLPHPPPFLTLASLPVPPLLLPLHACCILFRVILFWFSVNLSRNLSKFQGLEFDIRVRPASQSCFHPAGLKLALVVSAGKPGLVDGWNSSNLKCNATFLSLTVLWLQHRIGPVKHTQQHAAPNQLPCFSPHSRTAA